MKISDLVVIDEFFDDPEFIVEQALKQDYYDSASHPNQLIKINWCGKRTLPINNYDSELFNKITHKIVDKIVHDKTKNVKIRMDMFFHVMNDKDIFDDSWIHKDGCFRAGVVYLCKSPVSEKGTLIVKDSEPILIENVYNRFVMYDGNFMHSSKGGFGSTINDGRLTLVIFIDELEEIL